MSEVYHISTPPTSPTPRRGKQRLPEIALVGSRAIFSDNLIRATGQDFRELALIHVPSVAAFNALPEDETCWLRLVVVDDATMRNTPPEVLAEFSCPPSAMVVLAFHDSESAANCYHAARKSLPIESYVPLDVRLDVWLSIIKLLLHGGKYIPEELQAPRHDGAPPVDRGGPQRGRSTLGLTPRQYNVLELVSEGLPNKLIAARLGVSDHTVKLHIHNIISKLGVTNRTEAAARFHDGQT